MIILLLLLGTGCYLLLAVIPKVEPVTNSNNETTILFKSCNESNLTCNVKKSKSNKSIIPVGRNECALKKELCRLSFGNYVVDCGGIQTSFQDISDCIPFMSNSKSGSIGDNITNNVLLSENRGRFINISCFRVMSTDWKHENISDDNICANYMICAYSTSFNCTLNTSESLLAKGELADAVGNNSSSCSLECNFDSTDDAVPDFSTYQLYAFAILCIVGRLTTDCVLSLIDAACVEQVSATGADFGRQAVWSSFGMAAVSFPLAYAVGGGSYLAVYATVAATGLATAAVATQVRYICPPPSVSILKDFARVAKTEEFVFFCVGAFLNGVVYGAVTVHGLWYLQSVGADGWVLGLSLTLTQLAKAAFFFVSGRMLVRLGHNHVTTVTLLSFVVRCLTYTYLADPYWVLAVEWLHGTSALYYHCCVDFAKSCAKPGTENLMQTVVSVLYLCAGVAVGTFAAGLGFDYIGGRKTYFLFGVTFGVLSIANFIYTLSLKKRNHNKQDINDPAASKERY